MSKALSAAAPNSILGEAPPSINSDELSLTRESRVHLARLRCGHHLSLRSYENRLRPEVDPSCRWCGSAAETIPHLFRECQLLAGERGASGVGDPGDLWADPSASLEFLRSIGLVPAVPQFSDQ